MWLIVWEEGGGGGAANGDNMFIIYIIIKSANMDRLGGDKTLIHKKMVFKKKHFWILHLYLIKVSWDNLISLT